MGSGQAGKALRGARGHHWAADLRDCPAERFLEGCGCHQFLASISRIPRRNKFAIIFAQTG
jgi:hypothetical protein